MHQPSCFQETGSGAVTVGKSDRLGGGGKSKSAVVHKNLEDNYGAVISANHEALAQILEQVGAKMTPFSSPHGPLNLVSCVTSETSETLGRTPSGTKVPRHPNLTGCMFVNKIILR